MIEGEILMASPTKTYIAHSPSLHRVLEDIVATDKKARAFSLKLTMKNVNGDNVSAAFSHLTEAFPRFLTFSGLDKIMIGYVRSLNFNYNAEREDYHISIGAMLIMENSYFDNPLKRNDISNSLKQSLRVPYAPFGMLVSIKKEVDDKAYIQAWLRHVDAMLTRLDTCKDNADDILKQAIEGRKLISFGGRVLDK